MMLESTLCLRNLVAPNYNKVSKKAKKNVARNLKQEKSRSISQKIDQGISNSFITPPFLQNNNLIMSSVFSGGNSYFDLQRQYLMMGSSYGHVLGDTAIDGEECSEYTARGLGFIKEQVLSNLSE